MCENKLCCHVTLRDDFVCIKNRAACSYLTDKATIITGIFSQVKWCRDYVKFQVLCDRMQNGAQSPC